MRLWGVVLAALLVLTGATAIVVAEQAQAAPGAPSAPPPRLTYWQNATYGYVATLAPNEVYNTTTISNLTSPLYIPITRTVNLTLAYRLTTDRTASLAVGGSLHVLLEGTTWSRSIANLSIPVATATSTGVTRAVSYSFGVPALMSLVNEIENETGSSGASVTLAVAPTFAGSVDVDNSTALIGFSPVLDLTIAPATISLGPLAVSQKATLRDPSTGPAEGLPSSLVFAVLAFGALVAATITTAVLWTRQRSLTSEAEFESHVRPYAEAVAETLSVPAHGDFVALKDWSDIVKVADTLGRPILRFRGPGSTDLPPLFFVRDGTSCYIFRGKREP